MAKSSETTRPAPASAPAFPPPSAARPVPALPYRRHDVAAWPLETRLIVLALAVSAALGLVTHATSVWIGLQPSLFRTVGGLTSFRSMEFALFAWDALMQAAVVTGAVLFATRQAWGRRMLVVASAALLLGDAASFVYYTALRARSSSATTADRFVLDFWHVSGTFSACVLPALTLAALARRR